MWQQSLEFAVRVPTVNIIILTLIVSIKNELFIIRTYHICAGHRAVVTSYQQNMWCQVTDSTVRLVTISTVLIIYLTYVSIYVCAEHRAVVTSSQKNMWCQVTHPNVRPLTTISTLLTIYLTYVCSVSVFFILKLKCKYNIIYNYNILFSVYTVLVISMTPIVSKSSSH